MKDVKKEWVAPKLHRLDADKTMSSSMSSFPESFSAVNNPAFLATLSG